MLQLRKTYPRGTRVELVRMNDPYSTLKPGDQGTVDFIDDSWDSGSTLGIVYGEDVVKRL